MAGFGSSATMPAAATECQSVNYFAFPRVAYQAVG
jgi:hypothetical protein